MSTDTAARGLGIGWDERTEAWLSSVIRKNVWRVAPELDEDDLRQEAMLVWLKLNTSEYRQKIDARMREAGTAPERIAKHMFALFMTSTIRRFDDITDSHNRRKARMLSAFGAADQDEAEELDAPAPESTIGSVMLNALIDDAPEPFRSLLRAQLDGDLPESLPLPGGLRETRRQRTARAAGIAPEAVGGAYEEMKHWAQKKFIGR